MTSKSRTSLCDSAPSSPRRIGLVSASLRMLLQINCQSPALLDPHTWIRPRDTWTPPTGVGLPSRLKMNTPPIIWLRTMASDLEGLILIPVPSHLLVFGTSESCRSEQDEVKRTTSSANSTDRILRSPNQTPPPSIHPLGRRQLRLDMSLTSYRPCVADSHRIDKGTQRGAIHDSQSAPQDPSGHTVISLHSCKPSSPQKRM